MSLPAAALVFLMEKGLTIADAVELAGILEAETAPKAPTANALRQRRHRAKVAESVTNNVTVTRDRNAERVSPEPPSEITPIPPLKGGTFPKSEPPQPEKPAEAAKSLGAWVGEIWAASPKPGRERSGRRDLERALQAAVRRGSDPAMILAGVEGYYASPDATKNQGEFAKGVHVVVSSGRWEAFLPDVETPAVADDADPWPKRLKGWRLNGYWHSDWGPKPGKPGCQAPEEALMTAGYIPPPKMEKAA